MKKLFVLFLLVALVPFTVGCGLFGDNEDTTPVNIAKLKASVTMPDNLAGNSLRAVKVAPDKFRGFKILVGAVTLNVVAEEDLRNGNWLVDFESIESFNADQFAAMKSPNAAITIVDDSGNAVSVAVVDFSAGVPSTIPITVNADKTIAKVNNDLPTNTITGEAAKIESVTNADKPVSAGTAITHPYEFVVTTDVTLTEMEINHAQFSVLVGETAVEAGRHFTATASGKAITLTLTQDVISKLAANKVYTVRVNFIKAGDYLVANKTFSFKTPAAL